MYLAGDQAEKDVLRQGDVVSGNHILGAISLEAISYLEKDDAKIGWCVQAKPVFGPVVVLSDSCEIDPGNDVKVTSIILAPARDVSKATEQGKIDELRASRLASSSTMPRTDTSWVSTYSRQVASSISLYPRRRRCPFATCPSRGSRTR